MNASLTPIKTLKNAPQIRTTATSTATVPTPRAHSSARVTMVTQGMASRVMVSNDNRTNLIY